MRLPFETQNWSFYGDPLLEFLLLLFARVFSKQTSNISSLVVEIKGKFKENARRFEEMWGKIIGFWFGMKKGIRGAKMVEGSLKILRKIMLNNYL